MRLFCWRYFFFFKQKTAYEIRISDWSSDVCSSDLHGFKRQQLGVREAIMDLGEVQVIHGNSRSVVGPLECQVGAFEAGQLFSGKGKERKSGVEGKSVSVRDDMGGRRTNKRNTMYRKQWRPVET